jgi:hypothetical protein
MGKKWYMFGFLAIMALAIFLRFYHIDKFSLFSDERSSVLIGVANTNQGGMGELMRPDHTFTPQDFWAPRGIKSWFDADARGDVSGNSLLHDMMLKLFAFLFGKSDFSMRSVSVIFNLLTVWVIFRWARQIFPHKKWTLLVLFFAAIEPFFIIYSQQVRNYTTSLFFTTASNYLFWKLIIQDSEATVFNKKYFYLWVLASIGSLFSTYLTVLSLMGQGLYMLWQNRNKNLLLDYSKGILLIFLPIIPWFIWGPGKYFWQFQADAAEQLLDFIKANGEVPGWLELSSPSNLFKRTLSIWSDQFIWTNDLYVQHGYRIGAVLFVGFLFLLYQWYQKLSKDLKRLYFFAFIQLVFPVLMLFAAAVRAGTTSGFFLRYACFGLPFGIFISVSIFQYVLQQAFWYKTILSVFFALQVFHLFQLFMPLYSDQKQKYTYAVNRGPNPYPLIAQKIKETYQEGDTIVYPSSKANLLNSKHMRNRLIDPLDAQNVNLYFDGNETFIQRVDPFMKDSIMIYSKNGEKKLIFDFENGKYRY